MERVKGLPKVTMDSRIVKLRKQYEEDYDLSAMNSSNDAANLESLLRYQIIVEDLQKEINTLIEQGAAANITEIKKLSDAAKDMLDRCMSVERQLGIDRKTRKAEINTDSPAEYISKAKQAAKEFLEQRLIRVYCPDCNILVMRFSPAHDHTKFSVECKCSQCGKMVKARREDKDILFDVPAKDREWRKRYPVEVVPPKTDTTDDIDSIEDDLVLGE